jgi:hypothetical protein
MQNPYSKEVDAIINHLLDNYEFTKVDDYTAEIGGYSLWVGNIPYNCFGFYKTFEYNVRRRPSRLTIQKGRRKLRRFLEIQEELRFREAMRKIRDIKPQTL